MKTIAYERYCEGRQSGYLCVEGVRSGYYECSSPHFTGWRECGSGTQCQVPGFHTMNPCSPITGRLEEEEEEGGRGEVWSSHHSSYVGPGKGTVLEELNWWNWALIGVGTFLLIGAIVSIVIGVLMRLREKKRLRKTLSESQIFEIKEMARRNREGRIEIIPATHVLFDVERRDVHTLPASQNTSQISDSNTI